jgi:hypothetical protein
LSRGIRIHHSQVIQSLSDLVLCVDIDFLSPSASIGVDYDIIQSQFDPLDYDFNVHSLFPYEWIMEAV